MNITIEIDSADRFLRNYDYKHNKTRIRFFEGDYFIFPLIMFKNFHVQFDAENDLIKFYTTDDSILSLPKEEEKNNPKGFPKVLLAFIIVIIILVVSVVGFIIYRSLKKKNTDNIQKDIKKIEDIEEFHNMN